MIDQSVALKTWPVLGNEPDFVITLSSSAQMHDISEFVRLLAGTQGLIATKTGLAYAWLENGVQCAISINFGKMAIELMSEQEGFFKFKAGEGPTRKVTIENPIKKNSIYFYYTRDGKPDTSTSHPPPN